jgi:Fe-S-cluster containining protein
MAQQPTGNADGKPAVWGCARHAQLGPTCCQTSEIMVTEGDKERIAAYTGRSDFWHPSPPGDREYDPNDPEDPAWSLAFSPDGSRPILHRRADGSCMFLGERGCVLPLETRPLVCRLYPFEYRESGFTGVSSRCPAEVVPPGSTILETLEMDETTADRWRRRLYAELRAAPRRALT